MTNEYEMRDINRHPEDDRVRTNSVIVTNFTAVRQTLSNLNAADESRRTSRIAQGRDPNAPRAPKEPESIFIL